MRNGMRVIDIEHHFETKMIREEYAKTPEGAANLEAQKSQKGYDVFIELVEDLGEKRISELDKAGVDYAHISLTTPGTEYFPPEISKKIAADYNDIAADAIKRYPDRFGAWMALAPEDPEWSVKEIERCVKMGLFGWSCLSNMQGKYIDDPKYCPILSKLEELGQPMYIHPNFPTIKELNEFGYCTCGPNLGFLVDVQLCFQRMIYRGVFDKYPKLKVITGHDGEAMPFLRDRLDTAWRQGLGMPYANIGTTYDHPTSYYLDNNFYATTSGNFSTEALRCSVDSLPKGRVMLSTDFPYEDFKGSVDFIADNEKLTNDEKKDILANNAMALGFGAFKN